MSQRSPAYIMRHCDTCGKEVWRWPSNFPLQGVYCSHACQHATKRLTLTCETCGKEFQRARSRQRANRAYCSRECLNAARRAEREMRHCTHCNAEVWRHPALFKTKNTYCSPECHRSAIKTHKPTPPNAQPTAANDANVPTPATKAPPWPEVRLPEDDPRQRIRARFRAVRERWEATA